MSKEAAKSSGAWITRVAEASLEVRLGYTLRLVVGLFGSFAALFVLLGRPLAAVIDGTVAIALVVIASIARQSAAPEAHARAAHLSILVCLAGLTAASLISGHAYSNVPWFLVAIPLAAAYLLSVRAAVVWGLATVAAQVLVPLSEHWLRVPQEWVPDRLETLLDEIAVTMLILGLAVVWRSLADVYRKQVVTKEEAILQQAEELRKARDQALAAVRAREEFLANVSHEIRTPLNGVIGMANMLLETAELSGSEKDLVRTIDRSGRLLLALVNDILDFSKLESGRIELDVKPLSVADSVDGVVDLFVSSVAAQPIELETTVAPDVPPYVRADRRRLEQVLLNLVGNAVKFTERGTILVGVSWTAPDTLQIDVKDSGIGIAPDKLDRLFQPFSQVDTSTTRRHGGTGLGLVISRRLVEAMGGRIWVDSQPAEGSTFHFTLRAEPTDERPPLESADPSVANLALRVPLRILVAEDNLINRNVVDTALRHLGYRADIVGNGREALEAVHKREYDVVLMDLHMPEMDGLESTRRIREEVPATRQPWIVGLTASVLSQERERMRASGFDAVVPKPFSLQDLAAALQERGVRLAAPDEVEMPERPPSGERRRPVLPEMTVPSAERHHDAEHAVESAATTGVAMRSDASASADGKGKLPEPLEKLRQLCASQPGRFDALVRKYLQESSSLHERIVKAGADEDPKALEMAAHSLKSSSAMLGCMGVSAICAAIEEMAENGDVKGARAWFERLGANMAQDRERLHATIESA